MEPPNGTNSFEVAAIISAIRVHSRAKEENGFVSVPAGKRMVIEYVSVQAFIPSGQKALFSVIVFLQGQITGTWHYMESTAIGAFGGQDYFQCGRLVKLYADPGTTVMPRTDRDSPTGTGQSRMTLSGHLISVP